MARRSTSRLGTDPETVRASIVQSAIACFDAYGISKTTMDDIASRAGVSRPTLYRFFADRDALILAVIVSRSQSLLASARARFDRYADFSELLVEGLLWLVEKGRRDPYVRMFVSPEHMDLANRVLGTGDGAALATAELWRPYLESAIEEGAVSTGLDVDEACRWLMHVQLILVGRVDLEADPDALREMLRSFVLPAFVSSGRTDPLGSQEPA